MTAFAGHGPVGGHGFTVPVLTRDGEQPGLAEKFEHRIRPVSAGVAVPVFAFFAAGVAIGGLDGLRGALGDPVAGGVALGLVLGKFVGVFGTTYLLARFTRAQLDGELSWIDVAGLALLAGIGFTVSLLIGELAFEEDHLRHEHVKVGVLAGSLVSAVLASVLLRARNRVYRHIEEQETRDENRDDIPDVYQRGEDA